MKKILLISNMYPSKQKPYAGIFVLNQFNYLKSKGLDINIFYLETRKTKKIGSLIKYLKTVLLFIPHLFKKYDVIHIHYFFPLFVLAYIYKVVHPKTKIINTFHGSDVLDLLKKDKVKKLYKKMAKKCDLGIPVGKDLSVIVKKELEINKNKVLCAGIDSKSFYKQNLNKEFDFIYVGSFLKNKGVDLIIESIQKIGDKSIRYCFIGDGPYLENLQKLSNSYNITIKKNKTQLEINTFLNQSKFFTIFSRNDAFGLVVTESMYCGTPVIVSNIGGLKDQVKNDYNGFIVNSHDSDEIAEVLKKALKLKEHDYNEMAKNSLKSNKEYSLENVCVELIKIYEKI